MRTLFAALCLTATCPVFAATQDWNGRWDITANTQPRPRAWWLELTGVGGASPAGKFVSAYAGDLNTIDTIRVDNGELYFDMTPPSRAGKSNGAPTAKRIYRAHMVDGKLEGTFETEGQKNPPVKWTGVRAPTIEDRDDGTWKEGEPIALFNGKDLSGWSGLVPGVEMKWSVQDGVLRNAPPTTDIISDRQFWNFKLHVDFRIVEHSNSGIGLREIGRAHV